MARMSEDLRALLTLAAIVVTLIVLGSLAGVLDVGADGPAKTAGQVRTEHCERSWENSAARQYGGSKSAFMQKCRADLQAIEKATR